MPTTKKPLEHSTGRVREGKGGFVFLLFVSLLTSLSLPVQSLFAQSSQQLQLGQQFRLAEGIVRVAEPGELADTLNIWGDVSAPGRFIVPRGTTLPDLMSYARGPVRINTGETLLDWSEMRLTITVSRMDSSGKEISIRHRYVYNEPMPADIRTFRVRNGDLVSVQARRKPTWRDYLGVVSPTVSLALSAILLYDRATRDR